MIVSMVQVVMAIAGLSQASGNSAGRSRKSMQYLAIYIAIKPKKLRTVKPGTFSGFLFGLKGVGLYLAGGVYCLFVSIINFIIAYFYVKIISMLGLRQVVRQRVLVPSFAGSNPAGPATKKQKNSRREIFCFFERAERVQDSNQVRPMPGRLRQRRIVYILQAQPKHKHNKSPLGLLFFVLSD